MITDDEKPQHKTPVPCSLAKMSVPDLNAYIAELKAEILRVEEEIAKKQKHLQAADAFFKKKEE